jgi:hypothetical protein
LRFFSHAQRIPRIFLTYLKGSWNIGVVVAAPGFPPLSNDNKAERLASYSLSNAQPAVSVHEYEINSNRPFGEFVEYALPIMEHLIAKAAKHDNTHESQVALPLSPVFLSNPLPPANRGDLCLLMSM